ncbi:MAG: flagellar biosynthesis/type III secretory pathway M-ring protein FliF/YscJ [Zhongshania sp.]|jgi:flagellar biosynthesis/type III secretory pathway M-ring protein FliF/YscJ
MEREMGGNKSVSIASLIAVIAMSLCVLIAVALLSQAAWQQWRLSVEDSFSASAEDPLSLRETYLERKVMSLASSLLDRRDIKVTVQVEDIAKGAQGAERKTVLALINRATPDPNMEQALSSLVTAGLGLNEARGDQLAVKFHAFPSLSGSKTMLFGLDLVQRVYLGIALLLLGFLGLILAIYRYRQRRAKALQTEGDYRDQLQRFKNIAQEEPNRVASVLSEWLNGAPS